MITAALTAENSITAQNPNGKALLVIDVQENLLDARSRLHMDPTAVPTFTSNLNRSIAFFKTNQLPVIYTVNEWTNPILNLLTGNVCKKGGKGTGIHNKVNVVTTTIYTKSKMNALTNKQLFRFLKENQITELYISGLFAEACVRGTARGAIREKFNTIIIEDAVGSKSTKKKLASLLQCERKGANIISSDQLADHVGDKTISHNFLTANERIL